MAINSPEYVTEPHLWLVTTPAIVMPVPMKKIMFLSIPPTRVSKNKIHRIGCKSTTNTQLPVFTPICFDFKNPNGKLKK
jgi:hypothetical protein